MSKPTYRLGRRKLRALYRHYLFSYTFEVLAPQPVPVRLQPVPNYFCRQ